MVAACLKRPTLIFGVLYVGMFIWMLSPQTSAPMKPSTVPEISISDALAAIGRGAVVIDVRERAEFEKDHIAGAVSIPLGELKHRAAEYAALDKKELVIYCGNGSTLGPEGTQVLNEAGHPAARNLTAGLSGWKEAGHPVASGPR